jgi:peptide/nickel transport system permease protein
MNRYILRRLVISVPVLFGITLTVFLLVNLAPGDPISALMNPDEMALMGPEWVEQQRRALGLDQPLPVRYFLWLREVLRGNLGFSYNDRQPILDKMQVRIGPTVQLMLAAQLIAITIAVPVGVFSALRQYSIMDYSATVFGFAAISVPSFFLALGSIYIFSVRLGWMPTSGMGTAGTEPTLLDSLHHLALPAFVLGLAQAAPLIRYIRSSMLETVRQDFVMVARAKGLREGAVIFRHAFRNALIPVITIIALDLPRLFGGTIIIEQIFSWPGMGTLAITAVRARDYPVIMAVTLVTAVVILISNLLADILYAVIDPRIKYS